MRRVSIEVAIVGGVIVLLFLFLGGLLVLALSEDTTVWSETEDPNCMMQTERVRSMFSDDKVTITRYCKAG